MEYKTKGVCSQMIQFDIEDNKVRNVHFYRWNAWKLAGNFPSR